jgi:hypothetical protein
MTSEALGVIAVGLLMSFATAIFIALIIVGFYYYKNSSFGHGWLDLLGRPGEFDDEQAFAREEAEALETMDDMSRTEYLRAKGRSCSRPFFGFFGS